MTPKSHGYPTGSNAAIKEAVRRLRLKMDDKQKSGFEDVEPIENPSWTKSSDVQRCRDPEHHAPGMLVVPQGKRYRHVCPTCGHIEYLEHRITFGLDVK